MTKNRLDQTLVKLQMAPTRSQAESYIKLGAVKINGRVVTKPGALVSAEDKIILSSEQYVSRAGLKLASAAKLLDLKFDGKVVLDVGSSTGGFTDYSLKHGAKKIIAVDVGTSQLHPSLHGDARIELHEKTDIRNVWLRQRARNSKQETVSIEVPDLVLVDVSFISLREVLPHISKLMSASSVLVAMVKPQFEAVNNSLKHKGVIKNDTMRRAILKEFEAWVQNLFQIVNKADSEVAGAKGNRERFYMLKALQKRP